MSDYTLASMLVEFDGDTSKLDRKMDGVVDAAQRGGAKAGSVFALGFTNPVLNAIGGINDLLSGAQTAVRFGVSVTGMESAAHLGDYRRMLDGIAKDADKAEKAYNAFLKVASDSNFDTAQVFQFGVTQAGRTGDVEAAVRDTEKMLDASTVFAVDPTKFGNYQFNLNQFKTRGDKKIEQDDYQQFINAAPLAPTKIADALEISTEKAAEKIRTATGNEITDMIRLVGEKNKGAAAKAGAADPFKVANNIRDDAGIAMAPTGKLLNQAVTPLMSGVRDVVGEFQSLNKATGGLAGLVGIISLGSAGLVRFGGVAKNTWNVTTGFTGALRELATAEESAATATRSAASAARTKMSVEQSEAALRSRLYGFPMTGPVAPPWAGAEGVAGQTVTHAPGGFRDRLKGFGNGMKPMAPYGIALGLDLLGNGLKGDEKAPLWRRETGTALQDVGVGFGMGAPFGPIGMGVGTALGVGGAIWHVISDVKAEREKTKADSASAADALKDSAKSLKDAAGTLEKFSGKVYGGGARARGTTNAIERDYVLAHLSGVK